MENKLFFKAIYSNSTKTFIHSSRRQKINKFNIAKINQEGNNILTDNMNLNLFYEREKHQWNNFENLEKNNVNLFSELKNNFEQNFNRLNLKIEQNTKKKLISQYITSISPHFFEKSKIIKYNEILIKNEITKWGVDKILDINKLVETFDVVNQTLINQNLIDTKYNNFIGSVIHLDEKTPHMHSFFTNIDLNNKTKITIINHSNYLSKRLEIENNLNNITWIKEKENLNIKLDQEKDQHKIWKDNLAQEYKKMDKEYTFEELKQQVKVFLDNQNKSKVKGKELNLLEHAQSELNKQKNKDKILKSLNQETIDKLKLIQEKYKNGEKVKITFENKELENFVKSKNEDLEIYSNKEMDKKNNFYKEEDLSENKSDKIEQEKKFDNRFFEEKLDYKSNDEYYFDDDLENDEIKNIYNTRKNLKNEFENKDLNSEDLEKNDLNDKELENWDIYEEYLDNNESVNDDNDLNENKEDKSNLDKDKEKDLER